MLVVERRGNTNSKPKDYERALEICHQTRRPVHFIICHPEYDNPDDSGGNEAELLTLPWVPLEDLLKRNLHRLQTQGRFVPANAIADCCQRVTAMIPTDFATGSNDGSGGDYKNVEEFLVAIASPSTTGRGPRRNDQRRPNASFRYILSEHRLIQKQYPRNDEAFRSSNPRQNDRNRNPRNYEGRHPRPRNQN